MASDEIINTFFHDPSWSTPWSHEEVEPDPERYRRWRTQPWFDQDSMASNFLRESCNQSWPWGFVIYRTVYTPESDAQWSAALDKFDRYIYDEVSAEVEKTRQPRDPYPAKLVREGYRNVIFSDKDRFNGASIQQIREHFNQWKESHGYERDVTNPSELSRFNMCLMVDEKALSSLVASVAPGQQRGYCIMVDPYYHDGELYESRGYKGFMFVELGSFWWLFMCVGAIEINTLIPDTRIGEIPIYDGGYGKGINEDGKVIVNPLSEGRGGS